MPDSNSVDMVGVTLTAPSLERVLRDAVRGIWSPTENTNDNPMRLCFDYDTAAIFDRLLDPIRIVSDGGASMSVERVKYRFGTFALEAKHEHPAGKILVMPGLNTPSRAADPYFSIENYDTNLDHYPLPSDKYIKIKWQDGPIKENGVNGCQVEDVIQVAIDRLRELNVAPYNDRNNSLAITYLEDAQDKLFRRTREREARGVEGINTP